MAGIDLSASSGGRKAAARLADVISYNGPVKMPPAGKLPDAEIAALTEWVRNGAAWPESVANAGPKGHWAFEPLRVSAVPAAGGIDGFLTARRNARGLRAAPPADRLTLLRRAAFDLTGLPPNAEEQRRYLADSSPDAFANAVERLLASPRYGEKWGRHWLDVARYADSTGADEDYRYPYAWRYRDYVIDAFNRDIPYPQFVREQIAGDLLPPPAGQEVNSTGIIATGFLALGPKLVAEQDKVKMFYDTVDEQIDVTSRAVLGLTAACARCHDHKFDPIPTADYYALAGIFRSSRTFFGTSAADVKGKNKNGTPLISLGKTGVPPAKATAPATPAPASPASQLAALAARNPERAARFAALTAPQKAQLAERLKAKGILTTPPPAPAPTAALGTGLAMGVRTVRKPRASW